MEQERSGGRLWVNQINFDIKTTNNNRVIGIYKFKQDEVNRLFRSTALFFIDLFYE